MTDLKQRRQRAIAELIRASSLSSQEELAARLSGLGFAATQATISRDLEQIGAVKVRRQGQLSYALPDGPREPGTRLGALVREFVRAIDTAANLVVIKTPPGSAHLIGVALDESRLPGIVGTICGDDTLFAACPSVRAAGELARKLKAQAEEL